MISRIASAVLLVAALSFATDGIAVSSHWGGSDDPGCPIYSGAGRIYRYDIENDDVVKKTVLYDGCGRWATFSRAGTRVAFFRYVADSGWTITVMTSMGEDRTDIYPIPAGEKEGRGRLFWPVGDWIYFTAESNTPELQRVNVGTKKVETVLTFSASTGWWHMDAYAKRMSWGINRSHVRYELVGDGKLVDDKNDPDYVGYGCNNIISPSGGHFAWTTDAGHSNVQMRNWENTERWTVGWELYNSWATNAQEMTTTCGDKTVTVGNGFEGNRWSCNSDRWVILQLGFPPTGRHAKCGSNQVLMNWKDKKTIMVSFNPRASCKSSPEACDLHSTDPRQYNEAGDFFVTSPAEEINDDLRKYAGVHNRSRYSVQERGGFSVHRHVLHGVAITMPGSSMYHIAVYDMTGRAIWQSSAMSRAVIPRALFGRGVYMVSVQKKFAADNCFKRAIAF